jgi:hypothetical protein
MPKPGEPQPDLPFQNSLKDIRRVAKEIRRLNVNLKIICRHFSRGWATKPPLPEILPLPELLWKSPPQVPKEQTRPPKPSRASRRNAAMKRASKA